MRVINCIDPPVVEGDAGGIDVPVAVDVPEPPDVPVVTDAAVPTGLQLTVHAVNIVNSAAAAEIVSFLTTDSGPLTSAAAAFYAHFADEYDFLFVLPADPVPMASTAAAALTVHRPAIAGTGLAAVNHSAYAAYPHRRAVIGMNTSTNMTDPNGPCLREIMHYWGVDLDPALRLGADSHWSYSSVNGRLGGFDLNATHCANPATARPPACTPEADGRR